MQQRSSAAKKSPTKSLNVKKIPINISITVKIKIINNLILAHGWQAGGDGGTMNL